MRQKFDFSQLYGEILSCTNLLLFSYVELFLKVSPRTLQFCIFHTMRSVESKAILFDVLKKKKKIPAVVN